VRGAGYGRGMTAARWRATYSGRPDDVDVIAVSHLHLDHDGWLATTDAEPVFANATIHVGRADYEHFVLEADGSSRFAMADQLKAAL
jgi:glyoxylase-like metal-dependent hydrolase (beta-lactamase superfamily II)